MKLTRSLLRGFAVLEALAAHGRPVGPAKLGELVDLDKATVSRLLATFVHAGYVVREPESGRYRLSSRVLRLSRSFLEHCDLRSLVRPHLTRLRDATGETVHLGHLDGRHVVYVDKLESGNSVRLVSAIGQEMPLHTTALGKAMLAALKEPARTALLADTLLPARTAHSITDRRALLADLAIAAERGYALDRGENEANVSCAAAALRDGDGQILGAISVSGPTFRVGPLLDSIGAHCRRTAEAISQELPAEVLAPITAAAREHTAPAPPLGRGEPR